MLSGLASSDSEERTLNSTTRGALQQEQCCHGKSAVLRPNLSLARPLFSYADP